MAPQTFDGIRVSSQGIDLTPIEGEEEILGYIQFTPRGKRAQETDKVDQEQGAHAWGAINPKALALMGIIPAETGVPQMLMKAFADRGDSFKQANFSLTMAIRPHDDQDPESLVVQADPKEAELQRKAGTLGKLKNLGRLALAQDERALLRGYPQGTMANLYQQVEVRRYETVETDFKGNPVLDENGDEIPTTWMQVVGIA
jgi:hypothetical protein